MKWTSCSPCFVFVLVPAPDYVGQFLATLKEYPPRQEVHQPSSQLHFLLLVEDDGISLKVIAGRPGRSVPELIFYLAEGGKIVVLESGTIDLHNGTRIAFKRKGM